MQPAEVPTFRVTVAYMVGGCSVCRVLSERRDRVRVNHRSQLDVLMMVIEASFRGSGLGPV